MIKTNTLPLVFLALVQHHLQNKIFVCFMSCMSKTATTKTIPVASQLVSNSYEHLWSVFLDDLKSKLIVESMSNSTFM